MLMTYRLVITIALMLFSGFAAQAEPKRIVSLNPCLDTILVHVADRDQIAALSHYARDPTASTIADIARTLPYISDSAEEIIQLKPDLILSAGHSSLATRQMLHRAGFPTELFQVPNTVADSINQVRLIAGLVGHPERGEALIANMEAALAAIRQPPGAKHYTAIVAQPSGLTAGSGTLINEVMTIAGFQNVAARYGISQWGNISLEQVLAQPPQLILVEGARMEKPNWADRLLSHPALRAIKPAMKSSDFPQPLLFCGGPVLIKTAEALAEARKIMEATP